jgi:uncharacterized membrane protein YgcG
MTWVRRVVIGAVVLTVTAIGLLWPVVGAWMERTADESSGVDTTSITRSVASYDVAADGTLSAVEELTVDFPVSRHGIFRYWDIADPADPGVRYMPTVTSVTRDGGPEPYELSWDVGHRFLIARIGDPDRTLTGTTTYRITYRIPGAISPGTTSDAAPWATTAGTSTGAPGSAFLWSVVASGWDLAIDRAEVTIRLPAAAEVVQCATDPWGSPGPCAVAGAGTATVTAGATGLATRTGMIVRAAMQPAAPERATLPWSTTWDPLLGRTVWVTVALLLLSAGAGVLGAMLARSTREEPPGFPVQYAPPAGLGPVQAVYLDTEDDGPNPLVASVLHMAQRGLVRLERPTEEHWRIIGIATEEQWRSVDAVTREIAQLLGLTASADGRASFDADGTEGAGRKLDGVNDAIRPAVVRWSESAGLMEPSDRESTIRALWIAAAVLAVLLFALPAVLLWAGLSAQLAPTLVGLPFAAFVLGAVGLSAPGVGQRRTVPGRVEWARAGGFRRLLATPSSEERFDFAARQDAFIAFIPYAVAFGVADRWAEKYRTEMGQEPPIPIWYPMYAGHAASGFYSGGDFDSFGSSVRSSIAAYTAAQSASSSGGGGGGGGFGGGGGGGGGSW